MILPSEALFAVKQAIERQTDAMTRLGILLAEYESHKQELLAKREEWRKRQQEAVLQGLLDLGLPANDKKRHFTVDMEGRVFEIVNGERVIPMLGGE
jgi:uncharacterized UBP type Zn finger protein